MQSFEPSVLDMLQARMQPQLAARGRLREDHLLVSPSVDTPAIATDREPNITAGADSAAGDFSAALPFLLWAAFEGDIGINIKRLTNRRREIAKKDIPDSRGSLCGYRFLCCFVLLTLSSLGGRQLGEGEQERKTDKEKKETNTDL